MWSAEDVARASVRRQGEGLSVAQVADKVAEAERRERETQQQLNFPGDRGPYDSDPEDLAEQWVARHAEWRRVAALMDAQDWPVYSPEQDVQGSTWARERDAQREGALTRRAALQRERQDARDELKAQVWLPADASRRLRAIAARTSLDPEQVLAAAMNWALITMMTRRLTRKSPQRVSGHARRQPLADSPARSYADGFGALRGRRAVPRTLWPGAVSFGLVRAERRTAPCRTLPLLSAQRVRPAARAGGRVRRRSSGAGRRRGAAAAVRGHRPTRRRGRADGGRFAGLRDRCATSPQGTRRRSSRIWGRPVAALPGTGDETGPGGASRRCPRWPRRCRSRRSCRDGSRPAGRTS